MFIYMFMSLQICVIVILKIASLKALMTDNADKRDVR